MDQRISLITLGVRDMTRSAAFYELLGWQQVETSDGVIAFDLMGQTLGLFPLDALAKDIGLEIDALGVGGVTLSHNVETPSDVTALMAAAEAAGARVL